MSTETIGKQIRARRKVLKITQHDLAELASVSLRTVKSVENEQTNPTIQIVQRLLEPLGLKLVTAERITNE